MKNIFYHIMDREEPPEPPIVPSGDIPFADKEEYDAVCAMVYACRCNCGCRNQAEVLDGRRQPLCAECARRC